MNHPASIASRNPIALRNGHYWTGLLLCAALVPVLRSQGLPLRFDWITLGVAYWLVLAAQSIFVASLWALIGMPRQQIWIPFLARYRGNPVRIVFLLVYFGILAWATGGVRSLILTVDTVVLLEMYDRHRGRGLRRAVAAILPPSAYLFFGFLMVLAYNCAIVSARFNFAYDPALSAIDHWIMHGYTVSDIAHWAVRTFPLCFFRMLELIYFGMFPQIGAAIILVALCDGRKRALQFVGTLLVSYYIALGLFYLWPAQGPYYLCPAHFSTFPAELQAYKIQKALIAHALAMWHHEPISRISTDYYIALPCMHIAQPLIVMWFLRRWRRIVAMLAVYDLFLVVAILFLEWHYVIDILAGIFVACLAIVFAGGPLHCKGAEPATRGETAT